MNIAALIRILGAKGMSAADIADVVELAVPSDTREDRKRERDRLRMEGKREAERLSRDTGDIALLSDSLSEGSQGFPEPLPNPPNLSKVPPIVPQKAARKARLGPTPGAFARFWAEYPLKIGKLAAERAYAKAWGVVLDDDPEAAPEAEILNGLIRCKPLFNPEFLQHPATWLNKGGWMDQREPEHIDGGTGPPRLDAGAVERRREENRRLYGASQ